MVNILINGEIVGSFSLKGEQDKHLYFHCYCSPEKRVPSQCCKKKTERKKQCNDFQGREKYHYLQMIASSIYAINKIIRQTLMINERVQKIY